MKIGNAPGEYGFRALVSFHKHRPEEWHLSLEYFFSKEAAAKAASGSNVLWPVEVDQLTGAVYVPAPEELE